VDLLYDHLMRARATGAVFARTVVMAPWGLKLGGSIQLAVHAVARGRAWLWFDDPTSAVELLPGEITLVRGGLTHHIGHEPGADSWSPTTFSASSHRDRPSRTLLRLSSSAAPTSSRATSAVACSVPYHPC